MNFERFSYSINYRIKKTKLSTIFTNPIDGDTLNFNNTDFCVLKEILDILELFAEIVVTSQFETMIPTSTVISSIVLIVDRLKHMSIKMSFKTEKRINQLHQSVRARFTRIIKRLSMKPLAQDDPFHDPVYFVESGIKVPLDVTI
jgi:hypothetical protein